MAHKGAIVITRNERTNYKICNAGDWSADLYVKCRIAQLYFFRLRSLPLLVQHSTSTHEHLTADLGLYTTGSLRRLLQHASAGGLIACCTTRVLAVAESV